MVRYYFVDDYTIIQISTYTNNHAKDTINLYQEGSDIFSVSDQAMRGQVSETKTKWYLLEFEWDKAGNWRLDNNEAYLFLQTLERPQKIERLPPYEA